MGNVERGENFSSPSGRTISQIVQGAGSSVEIRFSDGSSFYLRPQDVRHQPGDVLSEDGYEALAALSDVPYAKKKALDLLAARDHSRQQLELKLHKRKIDVRTTELALSELQQEGVIDDRRFSEHWIEERLRRHPESIEHLVRGLMQRGVARTTARDAVTSYADDDTEQMALDAVAEKLLRRSNMNPQRFIRALASRGFAAARVYRARDKYFPETEDS